jgi:hypothetical protein
MKTRTAEQLQNLLWHGNMNFNDIHLSAAYSHLAKMQQLTAEQDSTALQTLAAWLDQLLLARLQQFRPRELANVVWACSKLQRTGTLSFGSCIAAFMRQLEAVNSPIDISNVLWAAANANYALDQQDVSCLVSRLVAPSLLGIAATREIAAVLWAVATLGLQVEEQQLHQLLDKYLTTAHAATPQELFNTFWALAKLNHDVTDEQLQCLMKYFLDLAHQATPHEISITIWSVASLGRQCQGEQSEALIADLCRQAPNLKPEDVSRTLWAVAVMKQQVAQQQLQQLMSIFFKRLHKASPQAVSTTLWALASMGKRVSVQQLQQMLSALVSQLPHVQPQDISMSLVAVATMRTPVQHDLLQKLLEACVALLPRATPQAVANTLWACATIKLLPRDLINALNRQQQEGEGLFDPGNAAVALRDLAQVAWAVGHLGYADQLLHGALLWQAVQQLQKEGLPGISQDGTLQDLCNICWSVAVLDLQQHVDVLLVLVERCGQVVPWAQATAEELAQLYQVHLWLLDCQQHSGLLLAGISAEQLQQCRSAWTAAVQLSSPNAACSKFQLDLFQQLQSLPLKWQQDPQLEQLCQPDGVMTVDVTATTGNGMLLAVEADGPSHFRWPESDSGLVGSTLYRNRALAARGYTVISVPYYEWKKLGSRADKQHWLARQIAEHAGHKENGG